MKVNDDSSNITRINLIYEGEVQGVGFRYFVKKKADSLGISGYVKNQNDGSVFVNAQGNISAIERLTKLCQIATPNSKVKSVVKIQKPIENIRGFRIIF